MDNQATTPATETTTTVADAVAQVVPAVASLPEGAEAPYVPPKPPYRPSSTTITIRSDSKLGEQYLTEVVQEALKAKGFSNVSRVEARFPHSRLDEQGFVKQNEVKDVNEAPSVLDALVARNPSFMQSRVTVRAVGHYPHSHDIPPDSEYPAVGAEIVDYKIPAWRPNDIVAVDALGGEQYIGRGQSPEATQAIIEAIKASGAKIGVDDDERPGFY
jgi:hypothetical protein